VPQVNVSTFKSKNDAKKTKVRTLSVNFNLILREKVMMIFPRLPIWDVIREPAKTITSFHHISKNIVIQDVKFEPAVHQYFGSNGF